MDRTDFFDLEIAKVRNMNESVGREGGAADEASNS